MFGCGSSGGKPTVDSPANQGDGANQGACATVTPIARLPACSAGGTSNINVVAGCAPNVDGTLHMEEWSDATCFDIGTGGDVVYAKYAGDAVYLAFSATPACGCGMSFAFDPSGGTTLATGDFVINVFDDPFMTNGDRGDYVVSGSMWTMGTAPTGIVTACPGNQPNPINYEFKLPFSALGITAGTAHTFRFAVDHPNGGSWPPGLTEPAGSTLPNNPANWGQLSSSSNWR
jgi:hypothetical protein